MLSAIFSSVGLSIVNAFLGKALDAFTAYNNKQISMEELRSRVNIAMADTFKEVEVAHAAALAATYATFMQAMVQSRLMKIVWASVTISQLMVLLWVQVGVSCLVYFTGTAWPSSGKTSDWAYLLVAACVGMGPIVLRSGPGEGTITEKLKAMVAK
jgi:hypothetical protein